MYVEEKQANGNKQDLQYVKRYNLRGPSEKPQLQPLGDPMPTYVYECAQCGKFEQHHSISEPALGCCPTCGGEVQRIIAGGTGFIMKGKGSSNNHCDRATPCCGRETRCNRPSCEK